MERTRIDTERNLLDVLDKVHEISSVGMDPMHVFDLKAINPHANSNQDTRTPEELLDLIEAKGSEVA